jgi:hypothetical protein
MCVWAPASSACWPKMEYEHTQRGPLYLIVYGLGVAVLVGAWFLRHVPELWRSWAGIAVVSALLAESLRYLTVRDEGDWLAIRFGPLPLFRKRIRYADVTAVEPDRTTFGDGWGIHWAPGRGWTYNLWGFDCVRLTLGRKVIRVGSDDVDNLVDFLRAKVGR